MAEKIVGFTIRPKWDGDRAQKALEKQSKTFRDQGIELSKLEKVTKSHLKGSERGLKDVGKAAVDAGRHIVGAFSSAGTSLDKFNAGVDKLGKKMVSLKTVVATSIVGGLAVAGLRQILREGQSILTARARAGREFGSDAGMINARSVSLGSRSGITGAEALRGLTPIAEAVQASTHEGTIFRGKRLTAAQAAAARAQTIGVGSNLLERLLTLSPDLDAETAGRALASAGTGPEGMRQFIGMARLNKTSSAELLKANAKGQIASMLSAEEIKKFDVKKGQQAGQGTILDILMQRSGMTDEAATAARSKFGFQMKSIGAQFEDVFGEIGATAIGKLNGGLKQGGTLAEKLQKYLASADGKKMVDQLATGVAKLVDGVSELAKKLPEVIGFLGEHKGLIMAVGGLFGGARLLGGIRGSLGLAGAVGGKVGGAADMLNAAPVRVVNWPGSFGGSVTDGLGDKVGKVAKLAGLGGGSLALVGAVGVAGLVAQAKVLTEIGEDRDKMGARWKTNHANTIEAEQAILDKRNGPKRVDGAEQFIASLVSQGASPDLAKQTFRNMSEADRASYLKSLGGGSQPIKVGDVHLTAPTAMPKGPDLAKWVAEHLGDPMVEHITREIQKQTANGAAPAHAPL